PDLHSFPTRRSSDLRNLLKDRAMDLLRDHIVSGRIPAGAKVVERDVAQLLGISRAPVRDALIQLETEGLVVSKPSGRYVIELSEDRKSTRLNSSHVS